MHALNTVYTILYRYSSVNGQKASAFKQKPFVRLYFLLYTLYFIIKLEIVILFLGGSL